VPHGQPLPPGAQLENVAQFAQFPLPHVQLCPAVDTILPCPYVRHADWAYGERQDVAVGGVGTTHAFVLQQAAVQKATTAQRSIELMPVPPLHVSPSPPPSMKSSSGPESMTSTPGPPKMKSLP
jgi:hypothetical protein